MYQINQFPITMTANGASVEWAYSGDNGAMQISGDFGGGTLTLETRLKGTMNFMGDPNFILTDVDIKYFENFVPGGSFYRFVLTGATNPNILIEAIQSYGGQ